MINLSFRQKHPQEANNNFGPLALANVHLDKTVNGYF